MTENAFLKLLIYVLADYYVLDDKPNFLIWLHTYYYALIFYRIILDFKKMRYLLD